MAALEVHFKQHQTGAPTIYMLESRAGYIKELAIDEQLIPK